MAGRDRWVDYKDSPTTPREPSSIPPEWHAWMHRMSDIPPTAPEASTYYAAPPTYVWKDHRANLTGTDKAYRPYNTTQPKFEQWSGKPFTRQQ
jgi:NADH dehydrogenase (ubiquinone) 1 alpha subcomplex subunit 12